MASTSADHHPEEQKRFHGAFHKDGDEGKWPISKRVGQCRLDLELQPSFTGQIRPEAAVLLLLDAGKRAV